MNEEKTRKVSLILPSSTHKKLKAIANENETSLQKIIEAFVGQLTDRDAKPITVYLPTELVFALDEFMKQRNVQTKQEAVEDALMAWISAPWPPQGKTTVHVDLETERALNLEAAQREKQIHEVIADVWSIYERVRNAWRGSDWDWNVFLKALDEWGARQAAAEAARFKSKLLGTSGNPDPMLTSVNRVRDEEVISIPGKFQPWASYLFHIIEQDNPFAAPSIKKNLEAFVRLTDLDGGQHGPSPGDPSEGIASADKAADAIDQQTRSATEVTEKHPRGRPGRRKAG